MNPKMMMDKLQFNPKMLKSLVAEESKEHKMRIVGCGAAMGIVALGLMGFHSNVVYRAW